MFSSILNRDDARRANPVVSEILAHGLRGALTGGLAIEAQLRAHGRPALQRPLNDVDFVIDGFASIPYTLAGRFLQNHVHPHASDGKTLLQFVDPAHRLRIDVFRAFGATLARAHRLDAWTGPLDVVSVEDLVARTTALVCGRLRRGRTIDVKHATAYARLRGLGHAEMLAAAWVDHRQQVPGTFADAAREADALLSARPELVIVETYSSTIEPCNNCREHGAFRPAPRAAIIEALGYC